MSTYNNIVHFDDVDEVDLHPSWIGKLTDGKALFRESIRLIPEIRW